MFESARHGQNINYVKNISPPLERFLYENGLHRGIVI